MDVRKFLEKYPPPSEKPGFTLTETVQRILRERYLATKPDGTQETPVEMFWRVAVEVAMREWREDDSPKENERRVLAYAHEYFQVMNQGKFLPNSPTLMNAGTENGLQFSACFVIPVEDSIQDIMEKAALAAKVWQSGGGTGFDFSRLRPRGWLVRSSGGQASGPVSFMSIFDKASDVVKQGGRRRAANMGILRVDHPDVRQFITAKKDGSLSNFNISVAITDEFMKALKKGEKYPLRAQPGWPRPEGGTYAGGEILGWENVQEIWDLIAQTAWETGDPGLFFVDRANERRIVQLPETEIRATNPCVAGNTVVRGPRSLYYVTQLVGNPLPVCIGPYEFQTGRGPNGEVGFFQTGVREVLRIEIADDISSALRVTPDHPVLVAERVPEEFMAEAGEPVKLFRGALDYRFYLRWKPAGELEPGDLVVLDHGSKKVEYVLEEVQRLAEEKEFVFLYSQYSMPEQLVRLSPSRVFPVLRLAGGEDVYMAFVAPVQSVKPDGVEPVYDVVVPGVHAFSANGVIVHNCGEQPLEPWGTCNLGSINLAAFVRVDWDEAEELARQEELLQVEDAQFWRRWLERHNRIDWDGLRRTAHVAVCFLDAVIDRQPYVDPRIEKMTKAMRRIGLGIMGFADLLFALGVPYDSPAARGIAAALMEEIHATAVEASEFLVVDVGYEPFPLHDYSYLSQLRRNSHLTTVAPTGSISLIAGVSSGLEPVFALAYQHRAKLPDGTTRVLEVVNPMLRSYCEERGLRHALQWAVEHGSLRDCPGQEFPAAMKRVFVTALEIAPEDHVRMQAAFQGSGVDSAVSKTVNLPHDATVEDVRKVYWLAYETGCLGVTVYRDGSKGEQVLYSGTKSKRSQESKAGKGEVPMLKTRPKKLEGATYRVVSPQGTVYVTINEDEGGPFEVFVNAAKAGSDVAAMAEAIGRVASAMLRLPSSMSQADRLREIARQLAYIGGQRSLGFGKERVFSLPDAVAKAILFHLGKLDKEGPEGIMGAGSNDYTVPMNGLLCPECGNATLAVEEGCKKCHTCGYSEC